MLSERIKLYRLQEVDRILEKHLVHMMQEMNFDEYTIKKMLHDPDMIKLSAINNKVVTHPKGKSLIRLIIRLKELNKLKNRLQKEICSECLQENKSTKHFSKSLIQLSGIANSD